LNIGFNAIQYYLSTPLRKRDALYNRYAISGTRWHNISTDYNFVYRNVYYFGEAAMDKRGYTAFVNGLLLSVDPKVDIALVHRQLSQGYQALQGNAFTENIAPTNERGLYLGLTVRPATAWRVAGYADFFKHPWLKYRVDAPSAGQDYLLQCTFQPNKKLEAYIRLRQEEKALNEPTPDSLLRYAAPIKRQNIRLHVAYQVRSSFSIKARSELMLYNPNGAGAETGFLIYAEAGYDGLKKLKPAVRLQYFNTGGYNSRIYAYERDVLYSYSIPAFFNKGVRYYFNLQYHAFKSFSAWLRWSQTVYKKGSPIGSGLTSIDGNTRSELKCQVSYRF
jgi:hypothetical protein